MKNIPQFNPADISSEYALLNAIIKDYLAKNLATVQPVQVIKVYEDNGFLDVSPLIEVEDTSGNLLAIGTKDTIYSVPIIQHFAQQPNADRPAERPNQHYRRRFGYKLQNRRG